MISPLHIIKNITQMNLNGGSPVIVATNYISSLHFYHEIHVLSSYFFSLRDKENDLSYFGLCVCVCVGVSVRTV